MVSDHNLGDNEEHDHVSLQGRNGVCIISNRLRLSTGIVIKTLLFVTITIPLESRNLTLSQLWITSNTTLVIYLFTMIDVHQIFMNLGTRMRDILTIRRAHKAKPLSIDSFVALSGWRGTR